MPTGYTAKLAEGEQSFEEFVLTCSRMMGALILMRDEPWDAPIPERFEPSDFYPKRLEEKRAELARITALSLNDAALEAFEERKKAVAHAAEYVAKRDAQAERYKAMRARVEAWQPPTPDHVEFKRVMIDQLNQSIDFDCGGSYVPEVPEVEGAEIWRAAKVLDLKRGIAYAEAEYAKEVERTEQRNRWIGALRDSLRETATA